MTAPEKDLNIDQAVAEPAQREAGGAALEASGVELDQIEASGSLREPVPAAKFARIAQIVERRYIRDQFRSAT